MSHSSPSNAVGASPNAGTHMPTPGGAGQPPPVGAHMPTAVLDPAVAISPPVLLGTPVTSSRQWTTALSPRIGGGWDFICQSYNYPTNQPTEWVVINLDTGAESIIVGANTIAANSNFQIASTNEPGITTNQVRAPNGRIFFGEFLGHIGVNVADDHYVNVAYFDPADRLVHQLPSILDPAGGRHSISFQLVFGRAGDKIYIGTQAAIGSLPFIFSVDPVSLEVKVIGTVGAAASANPKYAYYIVKDEGPGTQWLYVAVGQDPWELVKINIATGAQTVLYTTSGPGLQFISFQQRPTFGGTDGWEVDIIDNGVQTPYWLADGAITAYPGAGAPPGGSRTVQPYSNALVAPPTIDWSFGIGKVLWRPYGGSGAYTEVNYNVNYQSGIAVEQLAVLHDGGLFGSTVQYGGFFRRIGTALARYVALISSVVILAVSDALVYIAGYPNGALYKYNPTAAWDSTGTPNNPLLLGNFHADSGVKYSYFLELGANGRLYSSGRQERDSTGSGVGYYVPGGGTFAGVTAAPLDNLIPRGMVVMDGISRVVFSGKTLDATDAKLVVYDLNLNKLNEYLVQAGIKNTGLLYETADTSIVVGLTNDSPYWLYRFNVTTGTTLSISSIGVAVGASTQRAYDGSIWAMVGNNLVRIDPTTLARTTIADLTAIAPVTFLCWYGNTLYMGATEKLYASTAKDISTGHLAPVP